MNNATQGRIRSRDRCHQIKGQLHEKRSFMCVHALALNEIYPGRAVKAGLLWTDGPRLMEIPPKLIHDYVNRLWDLDLASLDGS